MLKKQKIVLIGAGSLQFGLGAVGNIIKSEILEGSTISLHDINSKALNLAYNACSSAIEEKKLNYSIESTTDRVHALKNATFIINSIEVVPRHELLKQDHEIPIKHGINQVLGENGGPGGFFHSLRVIPPILDICSDIQRICPTAFLINFSNPMSRICLAIKRQYPNLNFVGLCHEYQHHLSIISGILKTPLSNLELRGGGLNHFGVILEAKYKDSNKDAYPDIRKRGPDYLFNLQTLDGSNLMRYILESYGYIPYTTDSHYGEYIHWASEIADLIGVKRFIDTYFQNLEYEHNKIIRLIKRGKGARLVRPDTERAIPIIEGILMDSNYEEPSVNIPNNGIITNLPQDLVVECPAIVNKEGLKGIVLGEYPRGLDALLRHQASVQDLVVESILKKSRAIALQALLADPVVNSYKQAKKLLEEMLELQKDYLQIQLEK
jgi:alpha-galactosidase